MRLIDADVLFQHMNKRITDLFQEYGAYDHYATGFDDALTYIEDSPTIDAVPVVHARWSTHQECSVCGDFARYSAYGEPYYSRYCPNCGARMDAKE